MTNQKCFYIRLYMHASSFVCLCEFVYPYSIIRLLHLRWLCLYVQLIACSSTPFSLGDWILINIRMFAVKLKLSQTVIFHLLFAPDSVQMPPEGFNVWCTNHTLWEIIPYFHHLVGETVLS